MILVVKHYLLLYLPILIETLILIGIMELGETIYYWVVSKKEVG